MTFLSLLSLAAWIISAIRPGCEWSAHVQRSTRTHTVSLRLSSGWVYLEHEISTPAPPGSAFATSFISSHGVSASLSVLTGCLSILPVIWLADSLVGGPMYRRRKQRRCLLCGYDLTGNVSGVCPECGAKREANY